MKSDVLKAIAATAELMGREFSPAAAMVFASDLERYPEQQVMAALAKCRRECRGALTMADVVSRIDDGRPGPDEAWASIPQDDHRSVVWTDEMREAFGVALPLLREGDTTAARFAFREAYNKLVCAARDAGKAVNWTPSLGYDKRGQEEALKEAMDKGLISLTQAQGFVPALAGPAQTMEGLMRLSVTKPAIKHSADEWGGL